MIKERNEKPEGQAWLSDMVLREARETDATTLRRLKRQVFSETHNLLQSLVDYDYDVEEERHLIRRYRYLDNSCLLLALRGRDAVGFLTLQGSPLARNRHVVQLGIAVQKELWGLGIGRDLMDRGLQWARENPIVRKISLLVYSDNDRAIEMYERYGFQKEGLLRKEVYIQESDTVLDLVAMGLLVEELG